MGGMLSSLHIGALYLRSPAASGEMSVCASRRPGVLSMWATTGPKRSAKRQRAPGQSRCLMAACYADSEGLRISFASYENETCTNVIERYG